MPEYLRQWCFCLELETVYGKNDIRGLDVVHGIPQLPADALLQRQHGAPGRKIPHSLFNLWQLAVPMLALPLRYQSDAQRGRSDVHATEAVYCLDRAKCDSIVFELVVNKLL